MLAGCVPYRELQRPRIDGVVVDGARRPSGVRVTSCTSTRARSCYLRHDTRTDAAGHFSIPRNRQWHLWLPMEMPLGAYTVVAACFAGGRVASALVPTRAATVSVTLTADAVANAAAIALCR